ncbi:MAG: BrnA antitoxin family protein [Bauldia sp.]|nr:BrnA antitoxin family protein [Bauldia sp.]
MTGKKRNIATDLARHDAHEIKPEEYEDIPELTDDWFEQANLHVGGKLVRRGRPPVATRKEAVSIRLSQDVLRHFREGGPGWQTRINEALRDWIKQVG